MTTWVYTAETGLADGTAVTSANSGNGTAGPAFSNIALAGGGTITYSSASPIQGGLSLLYTATTTGDVARTDYVSIFSTTKLVLDFAFKVTSGGSALAVGRAGVNAAFYIGYNSSTNRVFINDAGNGLLYTLATVLTPGNVYRIGAIIDQGTSATTGSATLALYTGYSSTSPTESYNGASVTNKDFGAASGNIDAIRFGKNTSSGTLVARLDAIQLSDTRTTLFGGPPATGTPPTVIYSTDYAKAIIDVRGSTGDNVLTYTITPTTGTYEPVDGYFLVPRGVTYTVRATDTVNSLYSEQTLVITNAATGGVFGKVKQAGGTWT